jgi:hypothetical protein
MGHGHVTPNSDGSKARCGGPALCPQCAQEAATAGYREAMGAPTAGTVSCPQCGHSFAPAAAREPVRVTESTGTVEAVINGERTHDEIRDLVRDAISARMKAATGAAYCWVYVNDLTSSQVVYASNGDDLYQCSYAIAADGAVTLGAPMEVVRTYAPAGDTSGEPPEDDAGLELGDVLMESKGATRAGETVRDLAGGRVLEAKGTDDAGGRVFRMRIIAYGDSKNRRRYTEAVMRAAVPLYEGARAYDHHRTTEELTNGSLAGLCGSFRNVEAETDGLYGDLHLLPSATHVAETLDATLDAQEQGLPALVGVSHDVQAHFQSVIQGGQQIQEATQIVGVQSVDVVSTPAAGGKAVRAVAGGEDPNNQTDPTGKGPDGDSTKESDVVTTADVLAALKTASPEQLATVGLSKAEPAKESTEPEKVTEAAAGQPKDSFLGKMMIRAKVEDATLPLAVVESLTAALPDRITESDVDAQIASIKAGLGIVERAGLAPSVGGASVTQESLDKKVAALDSFFAGDYSKGYRSFKEAALDFSGYRPRSITEDVNKRIMRECVAAYDSEGRIVGSERTTESLTSSSWNLVLGDSITRRMVAEYAQPSLQTWRSIVSSSVPVNDFRTQRIDRVGGYGTLPTVNQGAPYQPLTSPGNEEVTYALTKRGGTEDLTLEMIANDDVRAIANIPRKLGLASAQTLYRFVWDLLDTNPSIYDSVALFHATHNNTATNALSQSNLSAARLAMRAQAAYGDTSNILSLIPRTLIVVNDLEEIAFQLATSAVAIPATPAGPTDTPNLHQGITPIIVDYWTSTTKWIAVADPTMCPTVEIGWYQGREDPELFTQSDPAVGSMFNADTVTYKIRHIYSGAVLDFRGFYRGNS